MVELHLVRHGKPLVSDLPRPEWPLDRAYDGEIESLRRSGALPTDARWFTSPERRAVETAEKLGHRDAQIVPDLREQERPASVVENLSAVIERSLAHPDRPPLPGWESARSVMDRLVSALSHSIDGDHPVVLVGHGFAWTLLVAHLTGMEPDFESWRKLLMPDHCSLDHGRVISAWSRWTSPR